VSVLRDGALVGTRRIDETNEAALIALTINRTIEQIYHKDAVPIGATILKTEALAGQGFHDVSIEVREGEIVGLYGLIGAGRSQFVQSDIEADTETEAKPLVPAALGRERDASLSPTTAARHGWGSTIHNARSGTGGLFARSSSHPLAGGRDARGASLTADPRRVGQLSAFSTTVWPIEKRSTIALRRSLLVSDQRV
jgi:ABC-type sugar transport system ATPase subunit